MTPSRFWRSSNGVIMPCLSACSRIQVSGMIPMLFLLVRRVLFSTRPRLLLALEQILTQGFGALFVGRVVLRGRCVTGCPVVHVLRDRAGAGVGQGFV